MFQGTGSHFYYSFISGSRHLRRTTKEPGMFLMSPGFKISSSLLVMLVLSLFLSGCLPGAKPPYLVELYTLDYPHPVVGGTALDQPVKVRRFSVAQSYNSTAMIYKTEPYKVTAPAYHKWRVNPGDMVTDYLLRDLRASGLFRGVFSYRDPEGTRFVVEGGVEELLQSKERDGWKAILGLQVTLVDTGQTDITKRLIFQKRYRVDEPVPDESPEAFAAGISSAMARASAAIIRDVREAILQRNQ